MSNRSDGFVGRNVLVTGAASGIGREAALAFAREGATLWLLDRNAAGLADVVPILAGAGHRGVVMDVTDEQGWYALAADIAKSAGCLHVLVNNAGHARARPLSETSYAQWRQDLSVMLDAAFLATRALLPVLAASGNGAIVNVSSLRGMIGGVSFAPYCTAKGGLRLFTKAVALECAALGNTVRANSLHPGWIETPLTAQAIDDPVALARRMAQTPLGRAGKAAEMADAILFLASDDSRYMTGAELVVDGGVLAG